MENGMVEKRAQELILEATKQIIEYQEQIKGKQDLIKDVKTNIKNEGINIKALDTAIKRYKAFLAGKDMESDLSESDLYLEVLKVGG